LFVDKLAFEIFTSAEEGTFEQELYDGVVKGQINRLQDINQLYSGIMKTYDSFFPAEPQRKIEWIAKGLVFEDPLYTVNYLLLCLLLLSFMKCISSPGNFAIKYNALLSNGFDNIAANSLMQYLGFELNYSNHLVNALNLMQKKTRKLNS